MFCEGCGYEIEEGDTFCSKCGRAVSGSGRRTRTRICRRRREGRMIAGVCAGVARYFDRDVAVIRIVWALAALIPPLFPGIAAYVIGWLLLPVSSESSSDDLEPEHAGASD